MQDLSLRVFTEGEKNSSVCIKYLYSFFSEILFCYSND